MMKDKNKIRKKIRYQSVLTFQTRDRGYYIGNSLSKKIIKLNPNQAYVKNLFGKTILII
jgi:hypothetical protein